MSIFSHYINRLIRFLGAWMLPLCMLFACTPSRHETSSPQTAETNPYTDSLLQFKIYLEQIRISRFKADTRKRHALWESGKNGPVLERLGLVCRFVAGKGIVLFA